MAILSLHSKFFGIFKRKINVDGVICASFMSRYFGIIVDLFGMYLILQIVPFVFRLFAYFYVPSLEAVERYKLGLELLPGEEQKIYTYAFVMYAMHATELVGMYLVCVFSWMKFGGSMAKLFMGMRVVDRDTLKFISFKQANKRFFSYPLSLLPIGLGVFWGAFDKRGQMLHDKLANTMVVYKEHSREMRDPCDELVSHVLDFLRSTFNAINAFRNKKSTFSTGHKE